MGFSSPAKDYTVRALLPEILCGVTTNSRIIETDSGYAVIEPAIKLRFIQVEFADCSGNTNAFVSTPILGPRTF